MNVTIPANSTAIVHVPAADPGEVKESGKPAAQAPAVKAWSNDAGAAVFAVGSGTYQFTSNPPTK
jgi:alpha-L-rhamnosidase